MVGIVPFDALFTWDIVPSENGQTLGLFRNGQVLHS